MSSSDIMFYWQNYEKQCKKSGALKPAFVYSFKISFNLMQKLSVGIFDYKCELYFLYCLDLNLVRFICSESKIHLMLHNS